MLKKYLSEKRERQAGIKNVFNDQYVLAFDRLIQVLDQFYSPG